MRFGVKRLYSHRGGEMNDACDAANPAKLLIVTLILRRSAGFKKPIVRGPGSFHTVVRGGSLSNNA